MSMLNQKVEEVLSILDALYQQDNSGSDGAKYCLDLLGIFQTIVPESERAQRILDNMKLIKSNLLPYLDTRSLYYDQSLVTALNALSEECDNVIRTDYATQFGLLGAIFGPPVALAVVGGGGYFMYKKYKESQYESIDASPSHDSDIEKNENNKIENKIQNSNTTSQSDFLSAVPNDKNGVEMDEVSKKSEKTALVRKS